jgi:hypothetical protein
MNNTKLPAAERWMNLDLKLTRSRPESFRSAGIPETTRGRQLGNDSNIVRTSISTLNEFNTLDKSQYRPRQMFKTMTLKNRMKINLGGCQEPACRAADQCGWGGSQFTRQADPRPFENTVRGRRMRLNAQYLTDKADSPLPSRHQRICLVQDLKETIAHMAHDDDSPPAYKLD